MITSLSTSYFKQIESKKYDYFYVGIKNRVQSLRNGLNIWIYRKIKHWFRIVFGLPFVNFLEQENLRTLRNSCKRESQIITSDFSCLFNKNMKISYFLKNISMCWLSLFFIHSSTHILNHDLNSATNSRINCWACSHRCSREFRSAILKLTMINGL